MSEAILAIGVTATCADGSVRNDVVLKMIDGVVIYETPDGEHLSGDCCVKLLDNARFVVPPGLIAQAIEQYRKQEVG
jgi:hypothetical protein